MKNAVLKLLIAVFPQEDWGLVFSTVFTGLIVVFIILGLLIGVILLMGKTIGVGKKKANTESAVQNIAVTTAVPNVEVKPEPMSDGGEVIAAIAAAIAAIGAEEGKKFRITEIKKKSGYTRPNWSRAGIMENTQPKG